MRRVDFNVKRGKWDSIIFTKEQEDYIIKKYTENRDISTVDLAKEFGVSYPIIVRLLKERKIERKTSSEIMQKYEVDSNFFDIIDTEEKAYWLGFLYADGFVNERENKIRLGLSSVDEQHLVKYKKSLKSKHPIKHSVKTMGGKEYHTSFVTFGNKHMTEQLVKKGCYQNKSSTLTFPGKDIVPSGLIHHFIRGYFDGDGSVYYTNRNTKHSNRRLYRVSFVGTEAFIKTIKEWFMSEVKLYKDPNKDLYELKMGGNQQSKKVYELLYKDATVFLDRKKEVFQDMVTYMEDNPYTAWNKGLTKNQY